MSKAALDRSRDFATCHPIENGAAYFQDGIYFDVAGKPLGSGTSVETAQPESPPDPDPVEPEAVEEPALEPTGNEDMDLLIAWGNGEKHPFFAVKKSAANLWGDDFGHNKVKSGDIRQKLAEEGLIEA